MKTFIYLLMSCLIISSCSKSDDDILTFLEKYDGSVWEDGGNDQYWRFINSLSTPIEIWSDWGGCYYYDLVNLIEADLEIVENINNRLVLSYDDGEGDNGIYTFTITGDSMEFLIEYESVECGGPCTPESMLFLKTTTVMDNLPLCDD
jgi:hypothetical protein